MIALVGQVFDARTDESAFNHKVLVFAAGAPFQNHGCSGLVIFAVKTNRNRVAKQLAHKDAAVFGFAFEIAHCIAMIADLRTEAEMRHLAGSFAVVVKRRLERHAVFERKIPVALAVNHQRIGNRDISFAAALHGLIIKSRLRSADDKVIDRYFGVYVFERCLKRSFGSADRCGFCP